MKYIKGNRIPEANIQAELYHQLMLRGIQCVLEHKVQGCRLDIIIVDNDDNIVHIIEVKSYRDMKPLHECNYDTKQIAKYSKLGVPITICGRMEHINEVINIILKQ